MMEVAKHISEVFNEDCMVGMAQYPDKWFDLAVVDPPYFSGPEKREFYGQKVSSIGVGRQYKKTDTWEVPKKEYFDELMRVSKKYIIWGCNYYDFNFHSGRIIWDKCNDASYYSDAEIAATNLFDHVRMFRYMWNGMMQGKSLSEGHIMQGNKRLNEVRIHPTQKPIVLYDWLYRTYFQNGGKVIDTHLGSGSSRISAEKAGNIDFTGFELDKNHFADQEKRWKGFIAQTRLFV